MTDKAGNDDEMSKVIEIRKQVKSPINCIGGELFGGKYGDKSTTYGEIRLYWTCIRC